MKSLDGLEAGDEIIFNDILNGFVSRPLWSTPENNKFLVRYSGLVIKLPRDEILAVRNDLVGADTIKSFDGYYDVLNRERLEEAIEMNGRQLS